MVSYLTNVPTNSGRVQTLFLETAICRGGRWAHLGRGSPPHLGSAAHSAPHTRLSRCEDARRAGCGQRGVRVYGPEYRDGRARNSRQLEATR